MPAYDIAHIREQGQDMILVPLDGQFEYKTPSTQNAFIDELQRRANAAGLAGRVAAIWPAGGYTKFMGPPQWRAFLQSISLHFVLMNVNRELSW
jgi:hypothetical protein